MLPADVQDFGQVYAAWFKPITAFFGRDCGFGGAEGEDLASKTFEKALKAWPAFRAEHPNALKGWLFTIANRVALDERRHRAAFGITHIGPLDLELHGDRLVDDRSPEVESLLDEQSVSVQLALRALPVKSWRNALVYREFGGLTYDEIARHQKTTRAAVKSRLFRARRAFAKAFPVAERATPYGSWAGYFLALRRELGIGLRLTATVLGGSTWRVFHYGAGTCPAATYRAVLTLEAWDRPRCSACGRVMTYGRPTKWGVCGRARCQGARERVRRAQHPEVDEAIRRRNRTYMQALRDDPVRGAELRAYQRAWQRRRREHRKREQWTALQQALGAAA